MTTQTEALKLALEGVEIHSSNSPEYIVCAALIKALAQPEHEPVAYGMWDSMIGCGGRMMYVRLDKGQDGCTVPLYTTQPQRKPMTEEQRKSITAMWSRGHRNYTVGDIIDAVEEAHGINKE